MWLRLILLLIPSEKLYCFFHIHHQLSIGYCANSRLYAVLETWGMLHNHQGRSPRWLCNIPKVSINSIVPRIRTITDLDYGWLALFSKELLFLSMQLGAICFCKQRRTWISSNKWFIVRLSIVLFEEKLGCYPDILVQHMAWPVLSNEMLRTSRPGY